LAKQTPTQAEDFVQAEQHDLPRLRLGSEASPKQRDLPRLGLGSEASPKQCDLPRLRLGSETSPKQCDLPRLRLGSETSPKQRGWLHLTVLPRQNVMWKTSPNPKRPLCICMPKML
jgi:hypothetical protein